MLQSMEFDQRHCLNIFLIHYNRDNAQDVRSTCSKVMLLQTIQHLVTFLAWHVRLVVQLTRCDQASMGHH